MSRTPRNYALEYQRNKQKYLDAGLSTKEAIQKARRHKTTVITNYSKELEKAVKEIKQGKSLSKVSKELHKGTDTIARYLVGQGIGSKDSRNRWVITSDFRTREMLFYSNGKSYAITVDTDTASLIGEYFNDVKKCIKNRDINYLKQYAGMYVTDIKGVKYYFETDFDTVKRLSEGKYTFESVYKVVAGL